MPTSRSSGRNAPRRTHALGGCKTCRRRHVKCDRMRPACLTCRAMGIPCEGFSSEIRWMPSKMNQPRRQQPSVVSDEAVEKSSSVNDGTRRHLYTEKARASMSTALATDLASGSVDASLTEIDARSKDPELSATGDIVIGPFGVLNFKTTINMNSNNNSSNTQNGPVEKTNTVSDSCNSTSDVPATSPSSSAIDLLLNNAEDFLQWDDLFDLGSDLFGIAPQTSLATGDTGDSDFEVSACESGISNIPQQGQNRSLATQEARSDLPDVRTLTPVLTDTVSSSPDVLLDAPFLLKHFQEQVIAEIMPLSIGGKSPWKILNIPVAMQTLSELAFFSEQDINHARMANFYSILACSAYHLSANPSRDSTRSAEYWKQIASQTYHEAKNHMQRSLQTEVYGPRKAKYKDQLMAIEGMTAFAILSCHQKDARCYMIDAERLLRLRGLAKREISRKARLLHHMYTWNRIVGESTYVLHEYGPSESSIEAINHHFRPQLDQAENDHIRRSDHNSRLDDFLRLRTRQSDSDLDIDEPKERETGLHDIHLEDSRRFSDTLYSQIYGIPETWLSLLSQTTRLANVIHTLTNSGSAKKLVNSEAWEALQRRSSRLENMICSLALRSSRVSSSHSPGPPGRSHVHMLRALNAALVIFFYRRVRQVHPAILQGYVDDVISALRDVDAALTQSGIPGPGTGWPAFVAGCEAITQSRRDVLLGWIEKGGARCGFAAFRAAKEVMLEVWKEQDEHSTSTNCCGGPNPTWVSILRQRKLWPIFC